MTVQQCTAPSTSSSSPMPWLWGVLSASLMIQHTERSCSGLMEQCRAEYLSLNIRLLLTLGEHRKTTLHKWAYHKGQEYQIPISSIIDCCENSIVVDCKTQKCKDKVTEKISHTFYFSAILKKGLKYLGPPNQTVIVFLFFWHVFSVG